MRTARTWCPARIAFSEPVRVAAGGPWQPPQRTLDAIHLATAVRLALDGLALVSYDLDQVAAAQAGGMLCLSPS